MSASSRFAVAIHVLTLLALNRGEPVTSAYIAASVNTNAVVIRRTLAALRRAKLVDSRGGNGGGWRIAREPKALTLGAIYQAVAADDALFAFHHRPPNADCPVGRHIQNALAVPFAAARRAAEDELARTTVADVLRGVQARAG